MYNQFVALGGNVKANAIYEATLPPKMKINPFAQDTERTGFVFAKYRDRRWYSAPATSAVTPQPGAASTTPVPAQTPAVQSVNNLSISVPSISAPSSCPPVDIFADMNVVSSSAAAGATPTSAAAAAAAWAMAQVNQVDRTAQPSPKADLFEGMTPVAPAPTQVSTPTSPAAPLGGLLDLVGLTPATSAGSTGTSAMPVPGVSPSSSQKADEPSPRTLRRMLRRQQKLGQPGSELGVGNVASPASQTSECSTLLNSLSLTAVSSLQPSQSSQPSQPSQPSQVDIFGFGQASSAASATADILSSTSVSAANSSAAITAVDDPLAEFPGLALAPGEVDELCKPVTSVSVGFPVVASSTTSTGIANFPLVATSGITSTSSAAEDEGASGFDFLNDDDTTDAKKPVDDPFAEYIEGGHTANGASSGFAVPSSLAPAHVPLPASVPVAPANASPLASGVWGAAAAPSQPSPIPVVATGTQYPGQAMPSLPMQQPMVTPPVQASPLAQQQPAFFPNPQYQGLPVNHFAQPILPQAQGQSTLGSPGFAQSPTSANPSEWELEQKRLQLERELAQIRLQQEQLRQQTSQSTQPNTTNPLANYEFQF